MLRGTGCSPAQAKLQEAKLVQASEAMGCWDTSDRRDGLRQADLQHLRALARASPRDPGSACSIGGEGGAAQLLYLAQRPARPTSAEVRRSDGMVSSQFTPSV